ncbi:hypothetical protein Bca52824_066784 [Brassica carinata]|uniref:Amino acid transporter transmembrane domain-containing protein n=1 Tax=Brassica carinata TaxID=52824 RepID=A0A8X7QRX8_BRACI|nr:hypothetical protein Bca52824_066784 [Brassica carinata]
MAIKGDGGRRYRCISSATEFSFFRGQSVGYSDAGNIIVSIVGTGVLGLPYAFRVAGWFAGSLGVIIIGFATYYSMLLLVSSFLPH